MLGIIASIIDGVLVGLVYGLAAMGLTLIWGVMDVINLTHGTMIVGGMFALYLSASALGLPAYLALPPVLIGAFLVGILLYWIAVHRMVGRPPLMSLLSTFSVNLVLIGIGGPASGALRCSTWRFPCPASAWAATPFRAPTFSPRRWLR
jgi:branched-chain amino acid transport system permease protein